MSSFELVTITVTDDDSAKTPVPGVVVRVFDSTGTNFIMQSTTDADGEVVFNLLAPVTYQARFFKPKFSLYPVQSFSVLEAPVAPSTNEFPIVGHVYKPPEAVHPRLCRCSGFFLKPNGARAPNHDIQFIAKFDPLLFEGDAMLKERVSGRTDEQGYFEIDLVRFGQYDVTVEGFEDQQRCITIPDYPSSNLPDLLFPVIDRVELDPPGPYNIGIGVANEIQVTPTVWDSSGRQLPGTALVDVMWRSSDTNVLGVEVTSEKVILRGLAPGAAQLQALRADSSIIRIPNTPVQGDVPANVSVS
jgi:hypothetical protein